MTLAISDKLGYELVKILGLEDHHILALNFRAQAGELVTVDVRMYMTEQQGLDWMTEIKKYKLVPLEDE